jgi:hypothetical protein
MICRVVAWRAAWRDERRDEGQDEPQSSLLNLGVPLVKHLLLVRSMMTGILGKVILGVVCDADSRDDLHFC